MNVTIAKCRPSQFREVSELIYESGKTSLNVMFTRGDKTADAFLLQALQQSDGQYGYGNQWSVLLEGMVVAVGTSWQKDMHPSFIDATLSSLQAYYSPIEMLDILHTSEVLAENLAPPPADALCLGHISVSPQYQRKGLAKKLIQFFKDQAKQKNKNRLVLDVEQENKGAVAFYLSQGFEQECMFNMNSNGVELGFSDHMRLSLTLK